MKKLGVAVIGTGFWGRNHARAYKELESTNLVAICDVNAERARNVADQFGVKAYTDSSRMLKNSEIEAVSVCTWSTTLAKEALKALEAGKHVLVEKPMAANTKQANKLLETAEENGLHLTVGFLMRFIPGLQNIREAIENKKVGELVCATAKRVSQWPERIGDVGVVKDTAIHDIDVMRYITREDPITVYAKTGSMRHGKFEDYAQIMLTYRRRKERFYRIQLVNAVQNSNSHSYRKRCDNETGLHNPRTVDRECKRKPAAEIPSAGTFKAGTSTLCRVHNRKETARGNRSRWNKGP